MKDNKMWYAFDSKCIFSNEKDEITKYSFKQLNEFYEEKVKKLKPKSLKRSVELFNEREEFKLKVITLKDAILNYLFQQENLKAKETKINDNNNKISEIEEKIKFLNEIKNNNSNQLERKLNELNFQKKCLLKEKNEKYNYQKDIQKEIEVLRSQILFQIIELKSIKEKISYIEDKSYLKIIEEIKENSNIIRLIDVSEDKLLNLKDSELYEKLKYLVEC